MIVLLYHRFGNSCKDIYCRNTKDFQKDLDFLKDYKVTDPYKMDGDVMITIDDGCNSVYEIYPLLKKYPAVLFIAPNLIGKKGYMTWEQVKELSKCFCIETHSYNHLPLKPMSEKDIEYELKTSRDVIAEKTGKVPRFMSLPGGRGAGDETIIKIAKKLGYKGIFTSIPGNNNPLNMYSIQRIVV